MAVFFAHPGWHIDRVARGETAAAWREALKRFDAGDAGTLKEDGGAAVYRASVLGRDVVLKRWDLVSLGSRAKAIVRAGRADRHWRNAAWMTRAGIETARCLALATECRRGGPRRWLVMETVPGKTLLEHLADGDLNVKQQHALAAAVGEQVAYLAACGRGNRDHKPSNLIVHWGDEGPKIAIIDCVAIQRRIQVERMLASLVIEPSGCGVLPRRTLLMRALVSLLWESLMYPGREALAGEPLRERRNRIWRDVQRRVVEHRDARPRVDPLARGTPRP